MGVILMKFILIIEILFKNNIFFFKEFFFIELIV